MCFSITASFSAGIVLTVVGAMTLGKVKTKQDILLASIPLLFAAQQFIEGLLWLVLLSGKSAVEQYWLTQSYAAFVGVIWPLVIPISIFLIEANNLRRRLVLLCLAVGIGLAIYTLRIIAVSEVNAVISNHCIQYGGVDAAGNFLLILYVIATIVPFFCSSCRSINIIGLMNMVTFFIAYYSYEINFASGWCFLAAVVSGFIYLHFSRTVRLLMER